MGCGLIGGSVALALKARGWTVSGRDSDESAEARALADGVVDRLGVDPDAEIVFVCTPADSVPAAVEDALDAAPGAVVTDVAGVKSAIASRVVDERFVPGHPMAGSEQSGLSGADATLFEGAVWVLCPGEKTSDAALMAVREVVRSLGADVVTLSPEDHDRLVAVVSHVPHLVAAALARLAGDFAADHRAVLRLAAGGFRDMTRVAAGDPRIWPDVCVRNADAISDVLDRLVDELRSVGSDVRRGDRSAILRRLHAAREVRRNLPDRATHPEELVEVRVPVEDRPGTLAELTRLAGELGLNIADIEIAHSSEGRGVVILLVEAAGADAYTERLREAGWHPATEPLA